MKVKSIYKDNSQRDVIILDDAEKDERRQLKEKLNAMIKIPDCVYSYTRGKSAKQAAEMVSDNIDSYSYFIKCDIKNYFGSINTEKLLETVFKLTNDSEVADSIRNIIRMEAEQCNIQGLSLGSPLSNVLSNIYLIEFDNYFANRSELVYLRFCDDMIFLCNEIIINEIKEKLMEYDLNLNEEKTTIGSYGDSITFLGFGINKKSNEVFDKIKLLKANGKINEFIDYIYSHGTDKFSYDDSLLIQKELSEEKYELWILIYEYIVLKISRDDLIEKLVNERDYKTAYELDEILQSNIMADNSIYVLRDLIGFREGLYYISNIDGKKDYKLVEDYLDDKLINAHLKGEISLAVRLDRQDGKSKAVVIDIDDDDLKKAEEYVNILKDYLSDEEIYSYSEFSGKKGFHLWIFFKDYIDVSALNQFAERIIKESGLAVKPEIIPKQNYLTETQNVIKLPLGLHPETSKKCSFPDIQSIEEIIENDFSYRDCNIYEEQLEEIKNRFNEPYLILKKCPVMNGILKKAVEAGEMNHFQRLMLLYVFFYVSDGREFIHFIMSKFSNYSYNITETYVNNAPENPISCRKIREYLKGDSILAQCSCDFESREGVYNSPILHCNNRNYGAAAVKSSAKDIIEELLKLKKEKEDIVKRMVELNRKLNSYFDLLKVDEIDIPMGKLRKAGNNSDNGWIIHIDI